jgi:hypothetical protein
VHLTHFRSSGWCLRAAVLTWANNPESCRRPYVLVERGGWAPPATPTDTPQNLIRQQLGDFSSKMKRRCHDANEACGQIVVPATMGSAFAQRHRLSELGFFLLRIAGGVSAAVRRGGASVTISVTCTILGVRRCAGTRWHGSEFRASSIEHFHWRVDCGREAPNVRGRHGHYRHSIRMALGLGFA